MSWLRTIFREIYGLFVDDAAFAVAIVIWVAVAVFVFPLLGWLARGRGPALFAGLAAILAVSAVRYARRKAG